MHRRASAPAANAGSAQRRSAYKADLVPRLVGLLHQQQHLASLHAEAAAAGRRCAAPSSKPSSQPPSARNNRTGHVVQRHHLGALLLALARCRHLLLAPGGRGGLLRSAVSGQSRPWQTSHDGRGGHAVVGGQHGCQGHEARPNTIERTAACPTPGHGQWTPPHSWTLHPPDWCSDWPTSSAETCCVRVCNERANNIQSTLRPVAPQRLAAQERDVRAQQGGKHEAERRTRQKSAAVTWRLRATIAREWRATTVCTKH